MNLGFFFIRTWGSFIERGSFGCVNRVVGSFIHIMKPKRNPSYIKLYLSVCFIPLSFAYTCILFFFFFGLIFFLLSVDIFKLFTQTQTLFKDLNMRSLSITNWCLSLCFKFNYFCLLAKKKKKTIFLFKILKKQILILRGEFFFFFSLK